MNTIATYAQDMSRFLNKSELTERRSFIESFVKEIVVTPDNALMRYTVPMPDDSLVPGEGYRGGGPPRCRSIYHPVWWAIQDSNL